MIAAIKYNLANLANFSGRDSRSTFWFYVLFLVILYAIASILVSLTISAGMVGEVMNAVKADVSEAELEKAIIDRISGTIAATVWVSAIITLVLTAMMAASFTRRLHDAGKSGWIAVLAVVVQVLAIGFAVTAIDDAVRIMAMASSGDFEGVEALQGQVMARSLVGWIPTVLVIVFGIWPSTDGANRYGPEPEEL